MPPTRVLNAASIVPCAVPLAAILEISERTSCDGDEEITATVAAEVPPYEARLAIGFRSLLVSAPAEIAPLQLLYMLQMSLL